MWGWWSIVILAVVGQWASPAHSAEANAGLFQDRAKRIFERVAGVPPREAQLIEMAGLLSTGQIEAAVDVALADSSFYNLSLKRLVAPWTNRDRNPNVKLNDYSATVIGMVRDNKDFREVLFGNHLYHGGPTVQMIARVEGVDTNIVWSPKSNFHYELLEERRIDLSDPTQLIRVDQESTQFSVNTVPPPPDGLTLSGSDPAGVLTTRTAGEAFLEDGTNRRMIRFTLLNHLCQDLESLKDFTVSDDRVRQDVDRSPGGNSTLYLGKCRGCHAIQDPLAGAFAYFNFGFGSRVAYAAGSVEGKIVRNSAVFPMGHRATSDHWENRLVGNTSLGWRGTGYESGNGAKSLGRALANSRAFSSCHVNTVFRHVCKREPSSIERLALGDVVDAFEQREYLGTRYNLKTVFRKVAPLCIP